MITVKWDKNRHLSVAPHRIIAVENENEVETVLFYLPKMMNGRDLSAMTASFATINNLGEGNIEALPVEVTGAEIRLRWQVTREYTSVPGSLRYEIIFSDGDAEFRTIRDFFSIVDALNAEDVITERNPAIIDQILQVYGDTVELYNALDVHIGTNGHWVVNHKDTGINAKGDTGENGVSVLAASSGEDGHLYLKLTNGDVLDVGYVKGDKGDAAAISIGSVTTGEPGAAAFVENVGTSAAAIFNFTIPRGLPGKNLTVLSLYPSLEELQSEHPAGCAGDAYAVGTETTNVIYIWDVNAQNWTSLGSLYNTDQLEGLLGIVPLDGGDFFEDYYNLDINGDEF